MKCWTPFVFQNVEANSSNLVNVRMIDLSSEKNFWRNHRIFVWKEKLSIEETSSVWSIVRPLDLNMEVSEVDFVRGSVDSYNWISY